MTAPSFGMLGNYLRVRGEYLDIILPGWRGVELPPRARRILMGLLIALMLVGTTSACAENTLLSVSHRGRAWNYLRVRGEYATEPSVKLYASELPPRARRIR